MTRECRFSFIFQSAWLHRHDMYVAKLRCLLRIASSFPEQRLIIRLERRNTGNELSTPILSQIFYIPSLKILHR